MEGKKLFLDGAQVSETKKNIYSLTSLIKVIQKRSIFFHELSMKNRDLDYDMLSSF